MALSTALLASDRAPRVDAPRCETCRHWCAGVQECRRHAPVRSDESIFPKWPRTDHNDWCGDHEPAAIAEHATEVIQAQHDETGRLWQGPRAELPTRYAEIGPLDEEREAAAEWLAAMAASGKRIPDEHDAIMVERIAAMLRRLRTKPIGPVERVASLLQPPIGGGPTLPSGPEINKPGGFT